MFFWIIILHLLKCLWTVVVSCCLSLILSICCCSSTSSRIPSINRLSSKRCRSLRRSLSDLSALILLSLSLATESSFSALLISPLKVSPPRSNYFLRLLFGVWLHLPVLQLRHHVHLDTLSYNRQSIRPIKRVHYIIWCYIGATIVVTASLIILFLFVFRTGKAIIIRRSSSESGLPDSVTPM